MKKYKYIWTVKSECGPVRKKNEDSIFPLESGSSGTSIKAGVFDGMGGHKKGEVASDLASKTMYKDFDNITDCLLYTSPSPRDGTSSRMPSSA